VTISNILKHIQSGEFYVEVTSPQRQTGGGLAQETETLGLYNFSEDNINIKYIGVKI
jgi:hypothetical protein